MEQHEPLFGINILEFEGLAPTVYCDSFLL